MKLIADSGSSKTEWRVIDKDNKIHQAKTMGLNPFHVTDEGVIAELTEKLLPRLQENGMEPGSVSEIYFYGSGCVPGEPSERLKKCLESVFLHAIAEVHDDLLAVARGLCGRDKGIVSILGTGSNSGIYDGEKIKGKITALGYILGDEGSGAWIGKQLIAMYLREELSEKLQEQLKNRLDMTNSEIFDKIYRTPQANRFLATYSRFVFQHLKEPQMYKMIYDGFRLFMEYNILRYPEHTKMAVHFSGSVAFYYANILRQVAADLSIHIGHIVEGPVAGLTLYHKPSIRIS